VAHGLDRASIATLFEQHYVALCRTARLLVDDPGRAEELVQDAFARTIANRGAVRDPSAAPAYLRRALVHACRSELRRRRVERRIGVASGGSPLDASIAGQECTDSAEDAAGETGTVLRALRALPPRQRETVVLRYYADLDEAAIAAAMGCSTGTVKSQLSKARAHLAALLADEERPR